MIISIHSPRVGRDIIGGIIGFIYYISIHSPRVGRDALRWTLSA